MSNSDKNQSNEDLSRQHKDLVIQRERLEKELYFGDRKKDK